MPRKVFEESCIACGTCKEECPVDAITVDDVAKVDPDLCIDCGACQDVCPVSAIIED